MGEGFKNGPKLRDGINGRPPFFSLNYLGFECVSLLREIFLPEVGGVVSSSVAPFEDIWGWHVGVLEVVVLGVRAVRAGPWDGQGAAGRLWVWVWVSRDHGNGSDK